MARGKLNYLISVVNIGSSWISGFAEIGIVASDQGVGLAPDGESPELRRSHGDNDGVI